MLKHKPELIVIGGSAGSFTQVNNILCALPKNFNIPIVLCLHRLRFQTSKLEETLNLKSNIKVKEIEDKEILENNKVYIAPANYHLLFDGERVCLSNDELVKFSRPSIDVAFDTASQIYKHKMLAVLLSGANADGAEGLLKAKQRGSYTVVQDIKEAGVKIMPQAALDLNAETSILTIEGITKLLMGL